MEIVPHPGGKAYVRLRTTWANYHSCSLYAIFRAEGRTLVHDGRTRNGTACRFRIEQRAGRFVLRDETRQCGGSCGERGSFEGDDRFRRTQRRSIRYLPRLLASDEHRAAVAADEGRIPRPETVLLPGLEEEAGARKATGGIEDPPVRSTPPAGP